MSTENNIFQNLNALTEMERRVLSLISENKTSKEIADILFISYRTVQNHRYNISQKLNLKGTNKLLEFALRNKNLLLDSDQSSNTSQNDSDIPDSMINSSNRIINKRVLLVGVVIVTIFIIFYFLLVQKDSVAEVPGFLDDKNRIAVLPLRLISPDKSDEYLSDGFTEELILKLSQIPELRVIARTSVANFRDNLLDLDEIAKQLNVKSILEGSIQKDGNNLRVNVQLIDTETKANLWSQSFDRNFADILTIQSEIASKVAIAMEVQLFLAGLDIEKELTSVNEEAHLAYLKGRHFLNQATKDGFEKSREFLSQSLQLDSSYANAWAGLADVYIWLANYGFMDPDEAFNNSRTAAYKALEIAPELSEAYTSIAAINLLYDWDFNSAEKNFSKALSLNPSDVNAHKLYALLNLALGNTQKAIGHSQWSVKLDPISSLSNAILGRTYYFAREYNSALEQYNLTLELDPNFWLVNSYLGELYLEMNKKNEAIFYLQKAKEFASDSYVALSRLGYGYARIDNLSAAENILNEIIRASDDGKKLSFQIALIYTALGNMDAAFNWIQKAYESKHDFMLDLKTDPKLDPLRADPRFHSFLLKMGIE